ncbi:MAG: FecR family protein [Opitutaceae bacterium]|jgi:hypothetical protein|nr:FecR family protein [Opitutaceae bacterium]
MSYISHFPARVARLFLFAALSLVSVAAQTPAKPAEPAKPVAKANAAGTILVVRVTGEAYATLPGDTLRMPLKKGSLVLVGQTIVTGKNASVMLVLSNGATVTVAGDSVMAVEEFTQRPFAEAFRVTRISSEPSNSTTRLNLVKGEIISDVKKLNKGAGSSFHIKTPVGVAGIRGTAFRLAFLETGRALASFNLVMLEGEIEMRFPGNPDPVLVPQGKELKLDNISVDPATGAARRPGRESTRLANASASALASIAQTVQVMISSADSVSFPPSGDAPEAGAEGGGAAQGDAQGGPESQAPASPGAQVTPPRLSPTDGE